MSRVAPVFLLSLSTVIPASAAWQTPPGSPRQTAAPKPPARQIVRGRVAAIHAPRVFTVRESARGRELLVLAPRPLSAAMLGASIVVEGVFRRLDAAELKRNAAWAAAEERTRARFSGRQVMVASSIVATQPLEAAPPDAEPSPEAREEALDEAAEEAPGELALPPREPSPLSIRATTLASYIDWLAGQRVRILNARVVGVLEPGAFLIEPATPYLKTMGHRDRVLVLIRGGGLNVDAELLVGAIVRVDGEARTLLGVRAASEVPWPARLTPDVVARLEVRAALLATSVQTPDGIELSGAAR